MFLKREDDFRVKPKVSTQVTPPAQHNWRPKLEVKDSFRLFLSVGLRMNNTHDL